MMTFRVHFDDETKLDVDAASPADARKIALSRRDAKITKIKALKERD